MKKKFLKPPSNRTQKILFCIALSEAISGKKMNREEILRIFKDEGIELNKELKIELMENFPGLDL